MERPFDKWVSNATDLGVDATEVAAAIAVHAELKVSRVIALDVMGQAPADLVRTVFARVAAVGDNARLAGLDV